MSGIALRIGRSAPGATADSRLVPGLVGRELPEKGGRAVFTERPFLRGELLVVWGGRILTGVELSGVPDASRLALQIDEDAYLVSRVEGPADWVNHCCLPNAGLRGQVTLVALRDLAVGEEVCFDYAMSDGSPYDQFDCRCGVPTCRGRITGSDWARPELIVRYAGHFSPYLQRRIHNLVGTVNGRLVTCR